MSSVNKDSFCFFFSNLLSYINISFSCLPPWCLIRVVRMDILALFLIMEETSWAFSIRCDVCCRLCVCVCVCVCVLNQRSLSSWGSSPLFLFFLKVLFMNGCWILSNVFLCVDLCIHALFFFSLLICWIINMVIHFQVLNQPCNLGINPT